MEPFQGPPNPSLLLGPRCTQARSLSPRHVPPATTAFSPRFSGRHRPRTELGFEHGPSLPLHVIVPEYDVLNSIHIRVPSLQAIEHTRNLPGDSHLGVGPTGHFQGTLTRGVWKKGHVPSRWLLKEVLALVLM